jgi:hypothetical protein
MRDFSLRHGPLMQLRICERVAFAVSLAEVAHGRSSNIRQEVVCNIFQDGGSIYIYTYVTCLKTTPSVLNYF